MLFAEGIILEKREMGEADWKYVALTREMGKIEFVSRGGRKVLARLSGHIEPLTFSSLEFTMTNTLKIIGGAGIHHFGKVKNDPVLFRCATDSARFLSSLLPFQYHDEGLFRAFYEYLIKMEGMEDAPVFVESGRRYNAYMYSCDFLDTCADLLGVSPGLQQDRDALQLNRMDIASLLRRSAYLKNHLKSHF